MSYPLTDEQIKKALDIISNLEEYAARIDACQQDINKKQDLIKDLEARVNDLYDQISVAQENRNKADSITNDDLVSRTAACAQLEQKQKERQGQLEGREKALQDRETEINHSTANNITLRTILEDRAMEMDQRESAVVSRETAANDREADLNKREQGITGAERKIEQDYKEISALRDDLMAQAADQAAKQASLDAWEKDLNDRDVVLTQKAQAIDTINQNVQANQQELTDAQAQLEKDRMSYDSNVKALTLSQEAVELAWLKINKLNQDKQLGMDIDAIKNPKP